MTEESQHQTPSNGRIAVAMSGGVDSSVTAALLAEEGYDVVGLTMQLYDHGAATAKSKACCAGQDIYDARRVAEKIGIPHYVLDYEDTFRTDVIRPFVQSYLQGETPIPCILCNQTVKFRDLIKAAKGIGAAALATGHYVRRRMTGAGPALERAIDRDRDQSYFLFATTRQQLEYLRFPLGDLDKSQTRGLAESFGLSVASKPDSQDICFVPEGRYTDVIKGVDGTTNTSGRFLHVDGRDMGSHAGIEGFTVGQRRGLGLGGEKEPLYVISVNPEEDTVVVGPKSALAKKSIRLRDINWLGPEEHMPSAGLKAFVRFRNTHEPVPAIIRQGKNTEQAEVEFEDAQFGVAPGQACVFYDNDRVLGGGWIMRDMAATQIPHNKRSERVSACS
jgi:tRNA-specific 2-thiouridylase